MTEPVPPLDSELRGLLRAEPRAPSDARERVRARLAVSVPGMRSPLGIPMEAVARTGFGAFETGALAVAAFVFGSVAGAALFARLSGEAPARVVYVDRPVPEVVVPAIPAPEAMVAPVAPEPAKPLVAEAPPSIAPAPRVADAPQAPHASQLAAERMVLDEARAAIIQGEPERALGLLNQHAARFPSGVLAEERDAMQVEALAAAGRGDEARVHADSFRAQRPNSLFLATVNSAIASLAAAP